jgi:PAS domain S-box-containing protein
MRLSLKLFLPALLTGALLAAYLIWVWAPRSTAQADYEYEMSVTRQLDSIVAAFGPLLPQNRQEAQREDRRAQLHESLDAVLAKNPDWVSLRLSGGGGELLSPRDPSLILGGPSEASDARTLRRPIVRDGNSLGQLTATVNLASARAVVHGQYSELLAVLLTALVIFLVLSTVAVEVFARHPLLLIARAATRFGQGDLQAELPAIRGGEIEALANGVSLMRDVIRRYETELRNEVSQRRRMEEALRESEERYSLAVRGANDGLWEWNLKTNEVYYSPRWKTMLGYAEDKIGNRFEEWENRVHPDDLPLVLADLKAHLDGRTPRYETEHRLRHKDGSYRWVLTRGAAIRHASGKPYRMVGLHTDITERKRVEEMLWRIAEATSTQTGE